MRKLASQCLKTQTKSLEINLKDVLGCSNVPRKLDQQKFSCFLFNKQTFDRKVGHFAKFLSISLFIWAGK